MRKVMLVDDEYMLLRGLKLLIDWESLGVGDCEYGAKSQLSVKVFTR